MSAPAVAHGPAPDLAKITRALISVSDKTGLVALGQALAARGVEILSTGGSAKTLAQAGVKVTEVSDYTGFPEIMDGRVKTLVPRIHGGILGRRDSHAAEMQAHDIPPIDLVVVNLYPFQQTVAKGADFANCVENIDIGGPALIRAAAKNHDFVAVLTDPADYDEVLAELAANDGATTFTRLWSKERSKRRSNRPSSPSARAVTPSGTPSQPTSSRTATTSERSRNSWVTAMCLQPWSTPTYFRQAPPAYAAQ